MQWQDPLQYVHATEEEVQSQELQNGQEMQPLQKPESCLRWTIPLLAMQQEQGKLHLRLRHTKAEVHHQPQQTRDSKCTQRLHPMPPDKAPVLRGALQKLC